MRENITSQSVLFQSEFVKPVLAVFDQPASSSDGGALLLKLADDRLGLSAAVAAALPQSSWEVTRTVAGDLSTYTIRVSWVDRATDTTNAAFDAGSDVGSNATGTGERFFYTATRAVFE